MNNTYEDVKKTIKCLLSALPKNEIDMHSFAAMYEKDIGSQIPYRQLKYCNLDQFLYSMSQDIQIWNNNGKVMLRAKHDAGSSHIRDFISRQKSTPTRGRGAFRAKTLGRGRPLYHQKENKFQSARNSMPVKPLPEAVKERILDLIINRNTGLTASEMKQIYHNVHSDASFLDDLNYKDYGYNSLEDLFCSESFICILRHKFEPGKSVVLFHPAYLLPDPISNQNITMDFGDGEKVLPGLSYCPLSISSYVEVIEGSSFLSISIGEIYNPHYFWFLVDGEALEKLIDEIQEFYKDDILKKWKLSFDDVKLGQPVIIRYEHDNHYYRAVITSFKKVDVVEVICVDYGTTCLVTRSELLYLHKKFLTPPAYAVRGRLSGIEPFTVWSKEASQRFLAMVMNKHLWAKIVKEEVMNGEMVVAMILFDGETPSQSKNINDILVSEELALRASEERRSSTKIIEPDELVIIPEARNRIPEASCNSIPPSSPPGNDVVIKEEPVPSYGIKEEPVPSYGIKEEPVPSYGKPVISSPISICDPADDNGSFSTCRDLSRRMTDMEITARESDKDRWLQQASVSNSSKDSGFNKEEMSIAAVCGDIDSAIRRLTDTRVRILRQVPVESEEVGVFQAVVKFNKSIKILKDVKAELETVEADLNLYNK